MEKYQMTELSVDEQRIVNGGIMIILPLLAVEFFAGVTAGLLGY